MQAVNAATIVVRRHLVVILAPMARRRHRLHGRFRYQSRRLVILAARIADYQNMAMLARRHNFPNLVAARLVVGLVAAIPVEWLAVALAAVTLVEEPAVALAAVLALSLVVDLGLADQCCRFQLQRLVAG